MLLFLPWTFSSNKQQSRQVGCGLFITEKRQKCSSLSNTSWTNVPELQISLWWERVPLPSNSLAATQVNNFSQLPLSCQHVCLVCPPCSFSLVSTHTKRSSYFQPSEKICGWFSHFYCCLSGKTLEVCGVWITPNAECWMGVIFPLNLHLIFTACYYLHVPATAQKLKAFVWGNMRNLQGLCVLSYPNANFFPRQTSIRLYSSQI